MNNSNKKNDTLEDLDKIKLPAWVRPALAKKLGLTYQGTILRLKRQDPQTLRILYDLLKKDKIKKLAAETRAKNKSKKICELIEELK